MDTEYSDLSGDGHSFSIDENIILLQFEVEPMKKGNANSILLHLKLRL